MPNVFGNPCAAIVATATPTLTLRPGSGEELMTVL
jgi:hypothetical protein